MCIYETNVSISLGEYSPEMSIVTLRFLTIHIPLLRFPVAFSLYDVFFFYFLFFFYHKSLLFSFLLALSCVYVACHFPFRCKHRLESSSLFSCGTTWDALSLPTHKHTHTYTCLSTYLATCLLFSFCIVAYCTMLSWDEPKWPTHFHSTFLYKKKNSYCIKVTTEYFIFYINNNK